MKFVKSISRIGLATACLCLLFVTTASATSTRVTPSSGYMAHDYTFEDTTGTRAYGAGLDVAYAKFPKLKNPTPGNEDLYTRGILHTVTVTRGSVTDLDINVYNSTGEIAATLFTTPGSYPQSVRIVTVDGGTDQIWFSYTGSSGAGYYSIPWTPEDLSAYPVTSVTEQLPDFPYSWEVEQKSDGLIFVCGMADGEEWFWEPGEPTPPPEIHTIYYWDQTGATGVLKKLLAIGGYSSGFAFDAAGNLWSGEYLLGWSPSMHVEPCNLKMWTKASVDAAISTGSELDWSTPDAEIALGTRTANSSHNWGPNDIESDLDGNIYVSMNSYSTWGHNTEFGAVKKYHLANGVIVCDGYISEDDCGTNNIWDWHKNLSYDGDANLDAGGYTNPELLPEIITGNRLFMDMDFDCGSYSMPDQFVVYASDADADSDGVPDSVDNAPETPNGGLIGASNQQDTDWDLYGNICDADFDNDGISGMLDFNTFKSEWMGSDIVVDMDSDGSVGISDFNLFKGRWLNSAPYY